MVVRAILSPSVDGLVDAIDIHGGLRHAVDLWRRHRGDGYPALAALRLSQATAVADAPLFALHMAAGGDFAVVHAGDEAAGWLGLGDETLLSRAAGSRISAALGRFVGLSIETGDAVLAAVDGGDGGRIETLLLPLATDHVHPDGVLGAVLRTVVPSGASGPGTAWPARTGAALPADPIASDIMSAKLITVAPDTPVPDVVRLLLAKGVSAAPVVDAEDRLIGIVSEADLVARLGSDPASRVSWWSALIHTDADLARGFVRLHGLKAGDVMTEAVVTAGRDTPLRDLVASMARARVRRIVVTDGHRPVGIVSRSDLLRAQSVVAPEPGADGRADAEIRAALLAQLKAQPWYHLADRNLVVIDGVACFWGIVRSEAEREALRVAAEETPGVRSVEMKVEVGHPLPMA